MQYTENCLVVKIENFHWKSFDIFLIFAQNIDCWYTLEPPRRGVYITRTCFRDDDKIHFSSPELKAHKVSL